MKGLLGLTGNAGDPDGPATAVSNDTRTGAERLSNETRTGAEGLRGGDKLRRTPEVRMHQDQANIPDRPAQQVTEGGFGLRIAEPGERIVHKQKVTD